MMFDNFFICFFQGYTNADNPFGDEHLLDTFVWQKKLETEGKKGLELTEIEKIQKKQMMDNRVTYQSPQLPI